MSHVTRRGNGMRTVHWTVFTLICLAAWRAEAEPPATAEAPGKVVLPEVLKLAAIEDSSGVLRLWTEVESKFKAGDPEDRNWVSRTLAAADQWAARPDSYYVGLFRPESPFGHGTICCPFHPQMSGWVPFKWDPAPPWRLTCPLCTEEGRKPDYYPNEL